MRGAYFAILSQALAAAFAILLIGKPTGTGGSTGLNGFRGSSGSTLSDPVEPARCCTSSRAGVLLLMLAVVRQLMVSRYGELLVACRDAEERVRFLGYDPANIKTVAFVVAAFMAGIGGALFVPIVGIVSPNDVGVVPSIGLLIGVAIGGRTTLLGPGARRDRRGLGRDARCPSSSPPAGPTSQGLLFMLVVAFLPGGLASLGGRWLRRRAAHRGRRPPSPRARRYRPP